MQDALQSSGLREYVTGFTLHRWHPHPPEGLHTVRGPHTWKSRTLLEVLFMPRRTPSQFEALLHSTKNSHTIRGPSSRQEELPHYSRPFFTPERLPVCTRPLINEQSAYKTPHVTTDQARDILRRENNSIDPALLQLNCSCKHIIVAQSTSHF